jgi:hypothetical protein
MRDLVAKLLELDDVNRLLGEMMSGLSTRYDLGSERDDVGRLIGDRPISHGSLYQLMQDGMGVLLDASTEGKVSRLVAATTQRISCVAVDVGPSMLIRPDACIAWAGEENSTDGLEEALHNWFIPTLDDGNRVIPNSDPFCHGSHRNDGGAELTANRVIRKIWKGRT